MIESKDLTRKSDTLKTLLKDKHGVRGKTLETRVARAGRRLPKRIRAEAQVITEAERLPAHPKLTATIDGARVDRAYEAVQEHLNAIDPKDRRKGQILGWLGGQAFNLIVISAALVSVLIWRGYIG